MAYMGRKMYSDSLYYIKGTKQVYSINKTEEIRRKNSQFT